MNEILISADERGSPASARSLSLTEPAKPHEDRLKSVSEETLRSEILTPAQPAAQSGSTTFECTPCRRARNCQCLQAPLGPPVRTFDDHNSVHGQIDGDGWMAIRLLNAFGSPDGWAYWPRERWSVWIAEGKLGKEHVCGADV